jgi:exodeoxyribonuclease V gamma subunit
LLRLYAQGLREPLAFFPRAAWAWIEGDRQGPGKAIAAFRPGGFNEFAEGDDPAYRLALRGRPDPFAREVVGDFYANAEAVFDPLKNCLGFE